MKAPKLYESVAFDSPMATTNDYGGVEDGWTQEFTTRANFRFLRGSEAVQAARLEGRQPVVATVRRSTDSEAITTDWRMRDTRRGIAYAIRSVIWSEDRKWVEITAESGVAA